MKDTIDQFMWGFQQHFRWRVGRDVERALNTVGLPVDVTAVLVGFARKEGLRHPICVEPEDGLLSPSHLASALTRSEKLFTADPESRILYTDHRSNELRRRDTIMRSRASAVIEALDASGAFKGVSFFVSQSAPINDYEVHTCVGIPTAALKVLPAFGEAVVDRVYVGQSLQHEIISECLRRADRALYLPDPGADLSTLGSTEEIIKTAAERFMRGTIWRAAKMMPDLFSVVNEFASLTYERGGAGGHLVITHKENIDKWLDVRFQQPISLHGARGMRKLLELSDSTVSVLADYQYAYGLGSYCAAVDVIEISVTGHAKWELSVNGDQYVRVAYGHATLPKQVIPFDKFKDVAERTVGDVDVSRLWNIIDIAQASGHGTTIVVTNDPAGETERLSGEAVPIVPDSLDPLEIVRLGRVDGALVLGPDGYCHAFGVILDGMATVTGDRSRGARFNSAVRYQRTTKAGAMAIVISADGSVDLIPQLNPRVYRDDVEAAVSAFCSCCEGDEVDGEEFGRTHDAVLRLAFYLNDDQCQRVNASYEKEMRRRLESGGISISGRHLRPDPRMNASYFWGSE